MAHQLLGAIAFWNAKRDIPFDENSAQSSTQINNASSVRTIVTRLAQAKKRAARLAPVLEALAGQGMNLRAIAAELDQRRIPTTHGGRWTAMQERRNQILSNLPTLSV